MDTRRDQVAGMGVPKTVKVYLDTGFRGNGFNRWMDHADAHDAAVRTRKDQTQVLPDGAQADLFFEQVFMV